MSTTTSLHDLKTARAHRLDSGTVNFQLADDTGSRVQVFLHTREQADALIRAAVAAKDLLPEPADHAFVRPGQVAAGRPAPDRCMVCGRPEADHPQPVLPPGHGPNHIDNAGHATLAVGPCEPGSCTCGARVDTVGHVTPAAVSHG